jgi:hypothetical protein
MQSWLRLLSISLVILFCLTLTAKEFQDEDYILINPRSVLGEGIYENNLQLLIDGRFVDEGTPWNNDASVYWQDQDTTFIVDLGAEYVIVDVLVQVDDNDDYQIAYSLDGVRFTPLLVFYEGYGETESGMDTMSSNPGDPNYASVPEHQPVRARYLRLSASSGDGSYAVAEVQAYGYPIGLEEEEASGGWITPESVTGYGEFTNEAGLIIDDQMPPEGSEWDGDASVFWGDLDTYFVIDLGQAYEITGITLQVSSQDSYRLDFSTDGQEYVHLVDVISTGGGAESGMHTMSSLPSDPNYVPEMDFFPVRVRYLRFAATEGDGRFAVSEIMIFGDF